jgi:ankyrin repeat protein
MNKPSESFISTNLVLYIRTNQIDSIREEMDNGADINAKYANDWTPIHYAIRENNPKILQLLIDNGADINAQNIDGNTPLIIATMTRNLNSIKTLIKHNANPNLKNKHDKMAIDYAEESKSNKLLTDYMGDYNA